MRPAASFFNSTHSQYWALVRNDNFGRGLQPTGFLLPKSRTNSLSGPALPTRPRLSWCSVLLRKDHEPNFFQTESSYASLINPNATDETRMLYFSAAAATVRAMLFNTYIIKALLITIIYIIIICTYIHTRMRQMIPLKWLKI